MNIEHDEQNHQFVARDGGAHAGEIEYVVDDPKTIRVVHTGVEQAFEGRGVGKRLVAAVVEFARARGARIVPECSFARGVLERTPEYRDLIA